MIKAWSRTQGTVALSSGEAEFYAAIKGIAEALGIQSLMRDLGITVKLVVHQDSTAAKGTLSRSGIGKVKHLDTQFLWAQDVVKRGQVKLEKVDGKINPADILTKPTSIGETNRRFGHFMTYEVITKKIRSGT